MGIFVLLTKLNDPVTTPNPDLCDLEREVSEMVDEHCTGVSWIANYAVVGPYDYLDVFQAPDVETAMKVSAIVRAVGAHTALWPAASWEDYKGLVRDVSSAVGASTSAR